MGPDSQNRPLEPSDPGRTARKTLKQMPTTPLFRLSRPLSSRDFTTYESALSRLQGNILKSHGREFAQHVFLTFRPEGGARDRARSFLSTLDLTSAAEQRKQTEENPHGKKLFTGLYLSAKGYQYFGYSRLDGFPRAFWGGMRAANLDDPPVSGNPDFNEASTPWCSSLMTMPTRWTSNCASCGRRLAVLPGSHLKPA
jgi:hypothetical protein